MGAGVFAAFPRDALEDFVLEPAAVEERDEERQAEGGDEAIDEREVGFGDPGVEADDGADPEERENPPGSEPLQAVGCELGVPELDA